LQVHTRSRLAKRYLPPWWHEHQDATTTPSLPGSPVLHHGIPAPACREVESLDFSQLPSSPTRPRKALPIVPTISSSLLRTAPYRHVLNPEQPVPLPHVNTLPLTKHPLPPGAPSIARPQPPISTPPDPLTHPPPFHMGGSMNRLLCKAGSTAPPSMAWRGREGEAVLWGRGGLGRPKQCAGPWWRSDLCSRGSVLYSLPKQTKLQTIIRRTPGDDCAATRLRRRRRRRRGRCRSRWRIR
jgi:hypothetical protein